MYFKNLMQLTARFAALPYENESRHVLYRVGCNTLYNG